LSGREGKSHDSFYAYVGEDGDFRGYFPGLATVRAAPVAGVFAFGVLADEDPVDVCG